jgi:PIN domain nuclease of toxin-antitoxin system
VTGVVVLDACALVALLKNESGADRVVEFYAKAKNGEVQIMMNRVNLLEVYYGFYRDGGKDYADKIIGEVERSLIRVSEFDKALFSEAGRLKSTYKISLADSIALAQALVSGDGLLTADHHEFDAMEGHEPIRFLWIR